MDLNEGFVDKTERFTVMGFIITWSCDKNCKYCVQIHRNKIKNKHMKIEDYKYVVSCIDEKDRENFRKIILTGGEPLLHPDFLEFVKLARIDFPKAEIVIQSNGGLLKTLPQKNLRVLPSIKNIVFNISSYIGWNDDIKEIYDNNYKPPNIWNKIIIKVFNNKLTEFISLGYHFPIINRIISFLNNPLKRGNVYIGEHTGFRDPYNDPKLSKEMAKAVRSVCYYHLIVSERNLYNCCHSEIYEKYYDTDPVGVEFDKDWKKNFFKLPTWNACVHCRMGEYRYRFICIESKLGYKKYKGISLKTRMKITNIKNHE